MPHGSDLADHIHTFSDLLALLNFDQLGSIGVITKARISGNTFGSNPQTADVEFLKCKADFFGGAALADEPALLAGEDISEWRVDTSRGMAWATLEKHSVMAFDRLFLEGVENRTGRNSFLREQIGRSDQNTTLTPRSANGAAITDTIAARTGHRGYPPQKRCGTRGICCHFGSAQQNIHHLVP